MELSINDIEAKLGEVKDVNQITLAHLAGFNERELKLLELFWEPAFNKQWIYLSPEVIHEFFGYKKTKSSNNDFCRKMKTLYKENIEYKEIDKNHELVQKYENFYPEIFQGKKIATRGAALKKYYAISGETFKKMGMRANTIKGDEICDYFIKVEKLANLMMQYILKKLEHENKELESENKAKDSQISFLHDVHKKFFSCKKKTGRKETIYIVSTKNYSEQGIYKIGRTMTSMKARSSGHNNTHIGGDKVKVIKLFSVNDAVLVERIIHQKLDGLCLEGEKEFFMCPYNLLESLVNLIVNNDDEENMAVNHIIESVYQIKDNALKTINWTQGIPANLFDEDAAEPEAKAEEDQSEKIMRELRQKVQIKFENQNIAEFDISKWNDSQKNEFIELCLDAYTKINNGGEAIYWKQLQEFIRTILGLPKRKFKSNDWKSSAKSGAEKTAQAIKWRN